MGMDNPWLGDQRDVVVIEGPDAATYLQSQASQDLEGMRPGESRWTFLLQPTGKVDVLARVTMIDDEKFELDTDAGFGPVLEARLNRFKIRVKATVAAPVSATGWTAADDDQRIAALWPKMGVEIVPGETIPAETGLAAVAVSFTKGCYPGQELVERMDSRGAKPPRLLRVFDVDPGVAAGDPIVDASGVEVGTYTSVAAGKALGYVRRGAALTSEV